MKKRIAAIIGIVVGVVAALAAVGAVLYVLDQKGVLNLKLKRTNYTYSEEFPDEEITVTAE